MAVIFFPWSTVVLFNAWTGNMFPSVKRKTAGDIIYPQCIFQLSRVEKYSLLGRRRTRKTSGVRKETKRPPLKMKQYNQLLQFTHEKYNYRQLRLAA